MEKCTWTWTWEKIVYPCDYEQGHDGAHGSEAFMEYMKGDKP